VDARNVRSDQVHHLALRPDAIYNFDELLQRCAASAATKVSFSARLPVTRESRKRSPALAWEYPR